jgi:GPH family glycoside/pentoside/hexuronide:cation symporter
MTDIREKVSGRVKAMYGVGDMGVAMLTAITQFFLMFYYTDVALIDPAIVGSALMVGKLTWDAVNDPLFGYVSDRTTTRWGRRRPYLLFGAIPLAIVTWLLFSIPTGLKGGSAFWTVLLSFLLFDTIHTIVSVNYSSLTPELSRDYDERTSITTVREIFTVFGYILGAATTTLVADFFSKSVGLSRHASYSAMGAFFGVVAMVAVFITVAGVREKPADVAPAKIPPFKAIASTFKNKPFMWLMGCFLLTNLAFTLLTTLLPYYLTYQLEMSKEMPMVMLAMLGAIGVFLYPMKIVADKIGKGPAYAVGLGIAALACAATFFMPHHPTPFIYVIGAVAGMGFSAQWVCPWSMLPDVIEYDELKTGQRQEGLYYGMWNFITKLTNAFGIALVGWTLSAYGYIANQPQTDRALFGIKLFFGPASAIAIFIALPFLATYPITRKSHAKILADLEARRASEGTGKAN